MYYSNYYYADYNLDHLFFYLLAVLINSCIFGAITYSINQSKGRDGGFWWGFFLGGIGIVVVAVRPAVYSDDYNPYASSRYPASKPIDVNAPVPQGGWRCSCGKVHETYVSSCSCGKSKRSVLDGTHGSLPSGKPACNEDGIDELRKYKVLLDDGLITQEDYDAKKKQLLNL